MAIKESILALITWITLNTGHTPIPGKDLPSVMFADKCTLERYAFLDARERECGLFNVVGTYDPKTNTMMLPLSFNDDDPNDRTTLVHELVHWMQPAVHDGDVSEKNMCQVAEIETEAYLTEIEYLKLLGMDVNNSLAQIYRYYQACKLHEMKEIYGLR